MSTTTLFVEILIVGFEALAWLAGLVFVFTGVPPYRWSDVKDGVPVLTLGLLAAAYVLGILVDRAADTAYGRLRRALERWGVLERGERPPAPVSAMRLWIMKESDGIAKFIDYQRSRVRIARATVLNVMVGTAVVLVWLWHRGQSGPCIVGVLGGGLLVAGLAFLAAEGIHRAHEKRLAEAYLMLCGQTILDEVVAAVCYRRSGAGVEFLLVRTTGGKYWTFPKGHIKKKERSKPWKAAEREAGEESGASGTVRRLPFAYYRYPAKKHVDYLIPAFLLEVNGPLGRHEAERDPTWCTPAQAKARFAEGTRKKVHVKQHHLVIDAALAALGPSG